MSSPAPFKIRLTEEEVQAVANGTMLGQLENGSILENPALWPDTFRGAVHNSLRGNVGILKYSWPACGCGVKTKIRAIPR